MGSDKIDRIFFALRSLGVAIAVFMFFYVENGECFAATDSLPCVVTAEEDNQDVNSADSTAEAHEEEERKKRLDNIRFEQRIDYVCLDDEFVRVQDGFIMVQSLRDGRYQEVIETARNHLNDLLKNPPWDVEYSETSPDPISNLGFGISVYLYFLAVALELNNRYDEALQTYGVIYKSNLEEYTWSYIRIQRSLEVQGKNRPLKPFQIPFNYVVQVVQEYHDLTPENVASVLKKVKTTEDYFFRGKNERPGALSKLGVPVLRDLKGRRDLEALELYRLRDRCAQVVCPKLHFTYPALYCDPDTTSEVESYAKLVQQSFAEFLDYMESEYQTFLNNPNNNGEERKRRAEDTMILLRSMKDLPH